jgi:serine/threonine protein kinase
MVQLVEGMPVVRAVQVEGEANLAGEAASEASSLPEASGPSLLQWIALLIPLYLVARHLARSCAGRAAFRQLCAALGLQSTPDEARGEHRVELPSDRLRRLARLFESMSDEHLRSKRYGPETAAACALSRDPHFRTLASLAAAEPELFLDDLVVEQTLGKGAFSTVQLCRLEGARAQAAAPTGASLYAVKRLLDPTIQEDQPLAAPLRAAAVPAFDLISLLAEGALLKTLQHPNLIACYGAIGSVASVGGDEATGADGALPLCALLLEHAPCGSLRERIDQRSYGPSTGIHWLAGIARGVAHLHELGGLAVMHRDLKPGNVLIGADGTAKICDFGLFRLLPEAGGAASKEREAALAASEPPPSPSKRAARPQPPSMTGRTGTPVYMAPECWMARAPYGAKVDVFSFAILAWEVLAQTSAYADLSDAPPERIGELVAHEGMRPYVPASWPAAIRRLLHSCWAAEPIRRPSARRVFHALESFEREAEADGSLHSALTPLPASPPQGTILTVFKQEGGDIVDGGCTVC